MDSFCFGKLPALRPGEVAPVSWTHPPFVRIGEKGVQNAEESPSVRAGV
jgi:hypothetical protein